MEVIKGLPQLRTEHTPLEDSRSAVDQCPQGMPTDPETTSWTLVFLSAHTWEPAYAVSVHFASLDTWTHLARLSPTFL